jgi:hypothetical protein
MNGWPDEVVTIGVLVVLLAAIAGLSAFVASVVIALRRRGRNRGQDR